MGYNTDFYGAIWFNKPIENELAAYINDFASIRHMKRDVEKIKELYPDWKDRCFNGDLGVDGEYFVGEEAGSVINYNSPGGDCPGLWCQWIINDNGELEWDGGEKFYDYVEWLKYLISNFFEPNGYVLTGEIQFRGEYWSDFGTITCKDNNVSISFGNY